MNRITHWGILGGPLNNYFERNYNWSDRYFDLNSIMSMDMIDIHTSDINIKIWNP